MKMKPTQTVSSDSEASLATGVQTQPSVEDWSPPGQHLRTLAAQNIITKKSVFQELVVSLQKFCESSRSHML